MQSHATPMEMIKLNERNIQLMCLCGRMFWGSIEATKPFACPSCKTEWSGRYIRYVRLRIRVRATDDYRTIIVDKQYSVGSLLQSILEAGGPIFHFATGVQTDEITRDEYYATNAEQVGRNLKEVVRELQEMAEHDQS